MNLTPRIFNVVAVVSLAPATGPHRLVLAKLALGSLFIVSLTAACALPWQERIYTPDDEGVTPPTKIVDVRAFYPQEAKDVKIEGYVRLTGVVHPDASEVKPISFGSSELHIG